MKKYASGVLVVAALAIATFLLRDWLGARLSELFVPPVSESVQRCDDEDDPWSCIHVGAMATREGDYETGKTYLKKACDLGEDIACKDYYGFGVLAADDNATVPALETLCLQKRMPLSCESLGYHRLYSAHDDRRSDQKAHDAFGVSCEEGRAIGCAFSAMLVVQNRVKPPAELTQKEFIARAKQRYATACVGYGHEACLYYADAVYDPSSGGDLFETTKEACADRERCPLLGMLIRKGIGTDRDLRKSNEYFRETCSQRYQGVAPESGCFYRGLNLIELGDSTRGIALVNEACERHVFAACRWLESNPIPVEGGAPPSQAESR